MNQFQQQLLPRLCGTILLCAALAGCSGITTTTEQSSNCSATSQRMTESEEMSYEDYFSEERAWAGGGNGYDSSYRNVIEKDAYFLNDAEKSSFTQTVMPLKNFM